MVLLRGILACAALAAMTWTSQAFACSCERFPRMTLDPLDAPYIFLGQVTTVEAYAQDPESLRKACFIAEYVAWGDDIRADREFCVVTGVGGGDCGLPFRPGEMWMVYAGESKDDAPDAGLPYTDRCWMSKRVRIARPHEDPSVLPSIGSFLVGAGLSAAAIIVLQKRRRSPRSSS